MIQKPKTVEEWLKRPWLQHPQESQEAYLFFMNYYLEPDTKTLKDAYKLYMRKEKNVVDEAILDRVSSIPSRMANWNKGKDEYGNDIEGMMRFEERRLAYKSQIALDNVEELRLKRANIVNKEYEDAKNLLDIWSETFDTYVTTMKKTKKAKKDLGEDYNITSDLSRIKDFVRSREEISSLIRKSVGMVADVKEDVYQEAMKTNKETENAPKVIWQDFPTASEKFEDEVDKLTAEEFETLLRNGNELYGS